MAQRGEQQQPEHDDDVQYREMRGGEAVMQAQPTLRRIRKARPRFPGIRRARPKSPCVWRAQPKFPCVWRAQPAAFRVWHQDVERREREGLREAHRDDARTQRGDDLQQARLDHISGDADAGAHRHREGEHGQPARRQRPPQPDAACKTSISREGFAPGSRAAGRDDAHKGLDARGEQHDGGQRARDGGEVGGCNTEIAEGEAQCVGRFADGTAERGEAAARLPGRGGGGSEDVAQAVGILGLAGRRALAERFEQHGPGLAIVQSAHEVGHLVGLARRRGGGGRSLRGQRRQDGRGLRLGLRMR